MTSKPGLKTVQVYVPCEFAVPYRIRVRDPRDLDEIKNKLRKVDPANWIIDPDFYEQYGCDFEYCVDKVTKSDVWDRSGERRTKTAC